MKGLSLVSELKNENILLVTLNRPDAMNSFNTEMLTELKRTIEDADIDERIRCIVITGARGNKDVSKQAFSAGADLKERKALTETEVRRFINTIRNTFTMVEEVQIPVIAAINGYAFGGGLELALACDIRIASRTAIMGLTETSLAIIPGAGGTQRLPRIIGIAKAKELIFTARRITAEEALRIGLVNSIAEPEDLLHVSLSMAEEIVKNGPVSIAQAKFAVNKGMEASLDVALHIESKAYEVTIPTEDRREALAAFEEKRKPLFRGR
ncbi:MAG: enoyl-CoA hydratase/isomerase family protein [Deltaproteobacteria bacterium]|nr:enoyl-CoA hydratase/isomerase family protein [Deltaproteobacteria bacterium]